MNIASYGYVSKILEERELSAKKKFGQNFLIDANIVDKIAKNACVADTCIEIGPGLGALSEMLLKYCRELYAYEIDEDMVECLHRVFEEEERMHVEYTDFLDVDLENVPYKDKDICVCSNLPYYVTTPILFKLFESDLKIRKITVMVQKEVADRFKADTGSEDYNALSVIVRYLYDVKYEMFVSKNVFYPKPKVDSAVISFTPKRERDKAFEKEFFELVKNCFRMRRKTLRNNLKDLYDEEMITRIITSLNKKDSVRAQELSLEDYLKMMEVIHER